MRINRRTVLLGLGTLVAGSGALLGTGAFTTVEAERTVTVQTAADADAFLGLQIRDDLAAADGTIDLDFAAVGADGVNRNARTVLDKVLLVENNGTQDGIAVSFEYAIDGETAGADELFQFSLNTSGDFDDGEDGVSSLTAPPLAVGEATAYDLEIDLRETELSDDAVARLAGLELDGEGFPVTVTVTADAA